MHLHMHNYKINSEIESGHKHRIVGYADITLGINNLHFHYFSGVSSYCNHTHYYSGFTSLPIKTEHGHIHKIDTILEANNFHKHKVKGRTYEEISYISGYSADGAFI